MLNSGKKIALCHVCATKKINIKKNHNPPFKLNGRSLKVKIYGDAFI
jgi:hypothetical protein